MKNAIMGCCLFLSGMYLLLICGMQFTSQMKSKELYSVADIAMKNAITYMYNTNHSSNEEVVSVMEKTISMRMMRDSEIAVELYTIDHANGVLSASFTSSWKQYNGSKKKIQVKRNMMIDQKKGR